MSTLQQVNLIDLEHKGHSQPFSLNNMLVIWGVVILFFMMMQTWGWYQTEKTRAQIVSLEVQQDRVLKQLARLREATPQSRKAELDQRLASTRIEVERSRQVLHIMRARDIVNENGFSSYLTGFSRQHVDGLSIDHFGLWEGGTYVELSGWTYRPEFAPAYVQRLQDEESFQHSRFGNLTLERAQEKRTDALHFKFGEAKKGS
jgi:hypothetical protein